MMKSNSHRGYGVKLMTEIEIEEMNEKYQEG